MPVPVRLEAIEISVENFPLVERMAPADIFGSLILLSS